MNKLSKILVVIILTFFFNCKTSKKNIVINHTDTKLNVVLKFSEGDNNFITSIEYPNKINLTNNSTKDKSFVRINYHYNDSLSKWANRNIVLYESNKELRTISNNQKKVIPSHKNLEYIYYTRHFIDSSKSIQQQFKSYIEKMLVENKDTLHIGTVLEFKKKHKELFEQLTKNDSISIRFLDGKKLGERITVPVKW